MTGVRQNTSRAIGGAAFIPVEKLVHFRTSSLNDDPSGRSILRNAYTSYHFATHIEMIESIAAERELNGIPVGRVPAEYLAPNATEAQTAFVNADSTVLGSSDPVQFGIR